MSVTHNTLADSVLNAYLQDQRQKGEVEAKHIHHNNTISIMLNRLNALLDYYGDYHEEITHNIIRYSITLPAPLAHAIHQGQPLPKDWRSHVEYLGLMPPLDPWDHSSGGWIALSDPISKKRRAR